MGRRPCCRKEGLNRGAWSAREDKLLISYIKIHGEGKWRDLPEKAGLKRCGKSCRLRWLNYLRPDIKRGNISVEEEDLIIRLHKLLGNRWSLIAGRLPGRTDNEIKNYWNTNLSKRVGNHGMHNPRSSKNMKGRTKNYSKKFKQARPAAVEPHRVIRTKAVRCSKVVIPGLLENGKLDIVGENISPSAVQQGQDDLADLLMDFDISELLLPEGLSSASPKAKEIGENKVVGGDCNVLEDMSPHPDYCSHFAHGNNFDDLTCGRILPENHGTIEPLPEILDLKSFFFLNSEDHEWNIDCRQI